MRSPLKTAMAILVLGFVGGVAFWLWSEGIPGLDSRAAAETTDAAGAGDSVVEYAEALINGKSVFGENEPVVGAAQFASPSELRSRVREEYEAGRRLTAMGRHREAVPHFNEAIRLDPEYADAYYRLGLTYVHLGDTGKAKATRAKLAKIDVDRANLLGHLIH